MLRTSNIKTKLDKGEVVIGANVGPDVQSAEMLLASGFDFLQVDAEHYSLSVADLENIVRAGECEGKAVVLRTRVSDARLLTPYLETGVLGLFMTHATSEADASDVVNAAKYQPVGQRGMGSARVRNYGRISEAEHTRAWNEVMLTSVILESPEALDNLPAILEIPGIDGIGVGLGDLSAAVGHHGDKQHPEVWAFTERMVRQVRDAGKWCSVAGVRDPRQYIDLGVQMFKMSGPRLLLDGADRYLEAMRG